MKRLLIIFSVLLLTTTITRAQSFHFGIKAGTALSGVSGNGMRNKFYPGLQGGVYAEKAITKKWSIQPEVLLTQTIVSKNSDFTKYYNSEGRPDGADKAKLLYLAIPVLVKYNVTPIISIVAGPQYSARLYANEDYLHGDHNAFKSSEFSATGGIQVNLGTVSFYGRYSRGISNINDIDDRYTWYSNQLLLGMSIKIK